VQAVVATIVSDADDYAHCRPRRARGAAGIRVRDRHAQREDQLQGARALAAEGPADLLVVGKREAEEGTVAIRTLGEQHQKVIPLAEAIALLKAEATPPDLRS